MTQEMIINLAQDALWTTLIISAPMLGIGVIVGLIISILQATTQIQEQTLTFVPKVVAILGSILIFGPWMLSEMIRFTENLFNSFRLFID